MVSTTRLPSAPARTGPAGRRLWRSVLADYDLGAGELALLAQAAAVADLCDGLAALVDAAPAGSSESWRAMRELRAQRTLFARLIATLRLPDEDDAAPSRRPQGRGPRALYGVRR